ncbi:hypothetical protein [Stenotrophomonas humi]
MAGLLNHSISSVRFQIAKQAIGITSLWNNYFEMRSYWRGVMIGWAGFPLRGH